jgi:RNA polymerase sigma factor
LLLTLFLGKLKQKERPLHSTENQNLHELIERIQQGEDSLRNELLANYRPFIGTSVSKVCKRYIDQKYDEEFSIGLEAFNEAISQYTSSKGSSFLSFADLVIRRRVIDFIRKSKQRIALVSLDEHADPESNDHNIWDIQAAVGQYQQEREADYRREEILHYKERLLEFDIALDELPDYTPRHTDARSNMIKIARMIAEREDLRETFLTKKKIPVKYLLQYISFSRKTIERNRNYIVAITLIFIEDYRYLRSYIQMGEADERGGALYEKGDRHGSAGPADYHHDTERGVL